MQRLVPFLLIGSLALAPAGAFADRLALEDVFQLEWASDPRISPDGRRVVYVRNFMDVMRDRRRSDLWIVGVDGGHHRPLTDGPGNHSSPRWSPSGDRLLHVASHGGAAQVQVRWMDTGQVAQLTRLTEAPGDLSWSPDGRSIAFSQFVPSELESFVTLPKAPEGATWAEKPRVIEKLVYRRDGSGYVRDGHHHLFVLPADGGTPRQVTTGDFDHRGTPSWTPDGKALVFSANRHDGWELDPLNSEVFELTLADGSLRALTSRHGPDRSPVVSPDGRLVAYLGFDDTHQGHRVTQLHFLQRSRPGGHGSLTVDLDRSVRDVHWSRDSRSLTFLHDDQGVTHVARVTTRGQVTRLASNVGGTAIGRPYASGSLTVAPDGSLAYTACGPHRLADVAYRDARGRERLLTRLNDDLLGHRELGAVEEIRWQSSHDGQTIQGWVITPPAYDPAERYPLLLEIHGGPFANYGPKFAAELQLYAAAGHVVFYANPRGSTSYGEEFANAIHHAYPGHDYDDLMSGVDAVLARYPIDPERLFVTGGSGGGVLSAWIVGKTDRFRAAVVAKPVINWYSFALTADAYNFFYRYWFPGLPWDHPEEYHRRSPISLAGQITTPTMVLTGERDLRTPMSESEQLYQALKLRQVDAALVRIPGASHGIARRPSQLIAKVAHVLAWFERHDVERASD